MRLRIFRFQGLQGLEVNGEIVDVNDFVNENIALEIIEPEEGESEE